MAASKKPRPVTRRDLREAAPEGWEIMEERCFAQFAISALCGGDVLRRDEFNIFHRDRQTARRMALAALNAMGKERER